MRLAARVVGGDSRVDYGARNQGMVRAAFEKSPLVAWHEGARNSTGHEDRFWWDVLFEEARNLGRKATSTASHPLSAAPDTKDGLPAGEVILVKVELLI